MKCKHCKTTIPTYISFGHPESTFEYNWICDCCGKENVIVVEEWISSKGAQNDVLIPYDDPTSIVRVFKFGRDEELTQVFPLSEFQWPGFEDEQNLECFIRWLSLEDVSDQLKQKMGTNNIGVIYIWIERPLYGAIYQYGNYPDDIWRLHAKTNGYA